MFLDGAYPDRYDLYRPTVQTSQAGSQTLSIPDDATSEDNVCRFVAKAGVALSPGERGAETQFDAIMFVPYGTDLLPEKKGQGADIVNVGSEQFVVKRVYDSGGAHMCLKVLLEENRQ